MAASRPYCSVCRSYYRGLYPVHASTAKHLHNARRAHGGGRGHRGDVNSSLGIPRINVRRMLAGDDGSDRVKVRRYHRSRPNDGRRKVVDVRKYWRRLGWRPTRF